ncbi:hypothetical protein EMCRGX_G029658 [Ephydatia muelleri]
MFVMKSLPTSSFKRTLVTFVVVTVLSVVAAYYYVFGFSRPYSPLVRPQDDVLRPNLPHPTAFLPVDEVFKAPWVSELRRFLESCSPNTVTLTAASQDYAPNLLNWLIAALATVEPPLLNVLVLSFDANLTRLLVSKGIGSIHVPYSSVVADPDRIGIGKIWMTRLAVLRIINYFGFNVYQFDTDAIVLRNPQPVFDLYKSSSVVSARAMLPFELGKGRWGFTASMGAVLFRSTLHTEQLWFTMHNLTSEMSRRHMDDQYRLNFALDAMGLTWQTAERRFDKENTGICPNGFKITVLPPVYICRKVCTVKKGIPYYIWHQSGGNHSANSKLQQSTSVNRWNLRKDWQHMTNSTLTGKAWLRSLSIYS